MGDVSPQAHARNGLKDMVVVVEGKAGRVGQLLGIQLGAQLGFDVVQAALDDGKDLRRHGGRLPSCVSCR